MKSSLFSIRGTRLFVEQYNEECEWGVLRSDPILTDEPFGLNEIIKDLEELRIQLVISKWKLLVHSFGGY
ncbi:hypothetical protein [Cohnella herbarum]|uniref:Uncharacterized protein n=1 Tax=Cohnella herbarum TaxID=2728023 RepID=A0A7Z2VHQ9_9BACL|nr:hypothetical protein [Cohnella herbarum]QJD83251.1 hypothetical protein HH215_08750 [Cohnella herbarum]